jgi:2-polyprenyl-3-methyl-5-hydroxy-6-metoxy-1,4-benzoquinol methylase
MKNSGERHFLNEEINNEAEYYNHLMHIATYQFALKYVKDKRVLDYGCGSGYGSRMLSNIAEKVTAVDISEETINFAKSYYTANNLVFKNISELSDEKYDIITSFQVIEHVPDEKEYIKNLKSLLMPDGYLLISTPDKSNRIFNYIQKPWNIFHLKEYSGIDLNDLLRKFFPSVEILKIGSKYEFVIKEITRTRKQRLITLPCTLFFYPYPLRVFLLDFQVIIYKKIKMFRKSKEALITDSILQNDFKTKYSVEDIYFANDMALWTDLLAICLNN